MTDDTTPQASYTAQHSPDRVGLGRTAGQRTAEIFAGLRAEMNPTPETEALSRLSGRLTARLLMRMAKPELFNFVPVRSGGFLGLIEEELDGQPATVVEIAAGFSPRGIQLAREHPELNVIEIDLEDVIEEKKNRLNKISKFEKPANLTWYSADLGVTRLSEVLQGQKVDVVSAEGLLPYFTFSEIPRVVSYVRDSLKPGGAFIADIGYSDVKGVQEASRVVSLFRRQTSTMPGSVHDEDTAISFFKDGGYKDVAVHRMPKVAERYDLPKPAPDVLFFMVARN
ncbi:MAG: class I SAM-dependent methyltransferase [Anaerolineae bacterium]|nr:class I SAM-dependent methyltransferase [Anaerolineae bacterium]